MRAMSSALAPASTMVAELDRIAERVGNLARLVVALREENQRLQRALDERDAENTRLKGTVDSARERVEQLIAQLPTAPE